MRRRLFVSASLATTAAALSGGLTSCSNPFASAGPELDRGPARKVFPIRLGDTVAEGNPELVADRYFGERLAALSKGAFQTTVFPNSSLGDANSMNEQVRRGTLHMTKTLSSNLTAYDKRLGVLSLPYSFATQDDLFEALAGELGTQIGSVLEKYGFKVLAFFDSGSRNVYNTKRLIHTPDDLKGLRLRVPQDSVALDTFTTLGAKATPMPAPKIYPALQEGTLDGAENNPIFYVTNKHVEIAKYFSWTRHQFGTDTLLASLSWFEQLGKDLQDALMRAGEETQELERKLWAEQTQKYVDQATQKGAKITQEVDLAAFQQAIKPVYTKHLREFGSLGQLLPLA